MAFEALQKFCWCGTRYAPGETVTVSGRAAAGLVRAGNIREVNRPRAEAKQEPPAETKQQPPARDKQQPPVADKQVTGGREK